MDKPSLPFSYYDILARIVPGAMSLGVLLYTWPDPFEKHIRLSGTESWKCLGAPLLVIGMSYVIGLLYEAVEQMPTVKEWLGKQDERAFLSAWNDWSGDSDVLAGRSPGVIKRFRYKLWNRLSQQSDLAFAHCHRFGAEYKMLVHAAYPLVMTALIALINRSWLFGATAICLVPIVWRLSQLRNALAADSSIYPGLVPRRNKGHGTRSVMDERLYSPRRAGLFSNTALTRFETAESPKA